MKKSIKLLVSVIVFVTMLCAFAFSAVSLSACGTKATKGLEYRLNEDGKGVTVVGIGSASDENVVIPAKYSLAFPASLPVTGIGDNAFENCNKIKSVTISEGVTSIGDGAFSGCSCLESVTIPKSLSFIGVKAFSLCSSLAKVDFVYKYEWKIYERSEGSKYDKFIYEASDAEIGHTPTVLNYLKEKYVNCYWTHFAESKF